MSDVRVPHMKQKSENHSPLMQDLKRQWQGAIQVNNHCPFGCGDHELTEQGYCGHLIGFYSGGTTYEPRMIRKKDGREVVDGAKRKPMEKGFKLVRITTCARVYSPKPSQALAQLANRGERVEAVQAELLEQERVILQRAEAIRNPSLEGDWGGTIYDVPATTAPIV